MKTCYNEAMSKIKTTYRDYKAGMSPIQVWVEEGVAADFKTCCAQARRTQREVVTNLIYAYVKKSNNK